MDFPQDEWLFHLSMDGCEANRYQARAVQGPDGVQVRRSFREYRHHIARDYPRIPKVPREPPWHLPLEE